MNRAEKRRAQRAGKTSDPLAITWYSNAMWAQTGYGTQTAQAVPRMVADGHAVAVAANYGLAAMKSVYEGIPHYPQGYETYSNDVIWPTFAEWSGQHPDLTPLVLALFDAWPLKGDAWNRMPVGIWTMIDHFPAPPMVLEFLNKPNVLPIAASLFARREIERAGLEALYVPMAIDTDVYRPTDSWTREDGKRLTGRQLMGFDEDVFVVSCINANKAGGNVHRKAWAENLEAFWIFAEGKDDVRLYMHTERNGAHGGMKFGPILEYLDLPPEKYRFVNQWAQHTGIPNEAMAAIYTATDVLLAPTYGEGFGLTVAEAGACETPAIVSDFTCQPELVTDDSYLVGGQRWYDNLQAAWWQIPSVDQIVEALEAAYARGRFRSTLQRQHIVANYDADKVFAEHWRPALVRLAEHAREHAVGGRKATPITAPARTWSRNEDAPPAHLTIYVPTFRRESLGATLASIAPQLDERVEVVISDNDPAGFGFDYAVAHLADAPCKVTYCANPTNIGGEANLLRGLESGSAPWIWMLGDDDTVLPGAVAAVLEAIEHDDLDRVILLSREAPSGAAGMVGTPADLEARQPGLMVAATLISANVVRRSALDLEAGRAKVGTMYGWAFAMAGARRLRVLASPAIEVGAEHAGQFAEQAGFTGDPVAIWTDLLRASGVEPGPESFSWNFVGVKVAA